jgi:hypothetical protein
MANVRLFDIMTKSRPVEFNVVFKHIFNILQPVQNCKTDIDPSVIA